MKKFLTMLLALVLCAFLISCKAKPDLTGNYSVTVDLYDPVVIAFDRGLGTTDPSRSIGNYLSDFTLTMTYAFHQDGTYKIDLDQAAFNRSLEALKAAVVPLLEQQLTETLKAEFTSYGIPLENKTDIEELMGKTMDVYFADAMGQSQEAFLDALIYDCFAPAMSDRLVAEGQFIAESGMLYLSDSLDTAPAEDRYETYVIGQDGTVVITDSVNLNKIFSYPYLLTPKHK